MLDGETVKRVGVVRGPDFFGAAEDPEIDTAATAGAGFDFKLRMFGAQAIEDGVKILT